MDWNLGAMVNLDESWSLGGPFTAGMGLGNAVGLVGAVVAIVADLTEVPSS